MIREANRWQRGHTTAEEAVYTRLRARAIDSGDGARLARVGASEISEEAAMCPRTALRAIKGLIAKQTISIMLPHDPATHRARLYRLPAWADVLAARAAAGLRWAERKPGGAVHLLTDAQADERPRREWSALAWATRHAPPPAAPAAPAAPEIRAPQIPAAEIMSQVWAEIAHLPGAEAATAAKLIQACAASGRTFDLPLLLHSIRKHAGIIARGKIHTPMAYLLKLVPQTYSGPGYQLEAAAARRTQAMKDQADADQAAAALRDRDRDRAEKQLAAIAPAIRDAARSTWGAILADLERKVIRQSFETWLKPTEGSHIEGRTLYVHVPSDDFRSIETRYGKLMREVIDLHHFQVEQLRFITDQDIAAQEAAHA